MKNIFIVILIAASFFIIPNVASASIDINLRYGSRGLAVTKLQEFLIERGFLATQASGGFYSLTRKSVIAYQASVGLPATGFVGPLTRAKINEDLSIDRKLTSYNLQYIDPSTGASKLFEFKTKHQTRYLGPELHLIYPENASKKISKALSYPSFLLEEGHTDFQKIGLIVELTDSDDSIWKTFLNHFNLKKSLIAEHLKVLGGRHLLDLKLINSLSVELPLDKIDVFALNPNVKFLHIDRKVEPFLDRSVPYIGADKVWANYGLTGERMKIAVLDDGIDISHEAFGSCTNNQFDLGQCKVKKWKVFTQEDCQYPCGGYHGTQAASIAAGNPPAKYIGVAKDADIWAGKVLGSTESPSDKESWLIAAIDWATDPNGDGDFSDRADVISMSLGYPGCSDDPVSSASDAAAKRGTVTVAAAGNAGGVGESTIGSPANGLDTIAVGAFCMQHPITCATEKISGGSSRGPSLYCDMRVSAAKPDIVAPTDVVAATPGPNPYVSFSGTSAATPHIGGVAALIVQANQKLTPHIVKQILKETAVPIPGFGENDQGSGKVDALAAINKAQFVSHIDIDNHARYTTQRTVALSLFCADRDADIIGVRYRNENSDWTLWEPYATKKEWQLSLEDGTKGIDYECQSSDGSIANSSATIIADYTSPSNKLQEIDSYVGFIGGSQDILTTGPMKEGNIVTLQGVSNNKKTKIEYKYCLISSHNATFAQLRTLFDQTLVDKFDFRSPLSLPYAKGFGSCTESDKQTFATRTYVTNTPFSNEIKLDYTSEIKIQVADIEFYGKVEKESGVTYTRSVTIRNLCADALSGVNSIRYRNEIGDWTGWQPYTEYKSLTLTEGDGQKTVFTECKDDAGNISAASSGSITLKEDKEPPSGYILINNAVPHTSKQDVTLSLYCVDQGIGVRDVRYRNENSDWTLWASYAQGSKPWVLSNGDGTKKVYYQCRDYLNNVAEFSDDILLDTTNPSVSISRPENYRAYVNDQDTGVHVHEKIPTITGKITVKAEAFDAGVGVEKVEFLVDNNLRSTDTQRPYQWTYDPTLLAEIGEQTITARAYDRLNHQSEAAMQVRIVGTQAPVQIELPSLGWKYRIPINVPNDILEITGKNILLPINTSMLINLGKLNSDCSDLRVTDKNSKAIPYWIENGCNTTLTRVWGYIPTLDSDATKLLIYYGRSNAPHKSDGDKTFPGYENEYPFLVKYVEAKLQIPLSLEETAPANSAFQITE